jgi:hypothetical protein
VKLLAPESVPLDGEPFSGPLCRPAKVIQTTDSDGENKREEDSKPPVQLLEKKWQENFELFREFKKAYPDCIFRQQSRTEDDTFKVYRPGQADSE